NGHTLIAPYRHIGDFTELTQEELSDMFALMQECVAALKKIYEPHGFNLGANLGRTSGAGLPDHLHFHIVPRWSGDTSFISTISDTKVVSIGIEETYNDLSKILNQK
ncbi:MAG TPA: HIT domain-containing protein, partial [Candidatus Kapabacteria bacterium]|nr:HIT domain-containing protein [Candidatus Kapabacteria bacterium]